MQQVSLARQTSNKWGYIAILIGYGCWPCNECAIVHAVHATALNSVTFYLKCRSDNCTMIIIKPHHCV